METQYHYKVMGRALEFVESARDRQPTLGEIAEAVGMSPFHFQKLFTEWVGVSPKTYLDYLNLDFLKTQLAEDAGLLQASYDAGLSSPSRAHDLFVKWEAMTPAEFARQAEGVTIYYDWVDTPFGAAIAFATARGLTGLGFQGENSEEDTFLDMARRWPKARIEAGNGYARRYLERFFQGEAIEIFTIGTPFQRQVWRALVNIPDGHLSSYSEIAAVIGKDKAVRAVGSAIGANPLSLIIPCHRALRKNGDLGGYHWGLPTKKLILVHEAAERADLHSRESASSCTNLKSL